jgi:hypothetical protein
MMHHIEQVRRRKQESGLHKELLLRAGLAEEPHYIRPREH